MVGATIRGECDHGPKCVMPGCSPIILMLQIDNAGDEAILKEIITNVAPSLLAPISGVQASPVEVKNLANEIMNVIIGFQIFKAHQEFHQQNPDPPTAGEPVIPDDNPFEEMKFYDYDAATWSKDA